MKEFDIDVVEVVRCKDCKYFIDQSDLCYGQDMCVEEGYDCYKNDDDFAVVVKGGARSDE